jgi:hypothetical protein
MQKTERRYFIGALVLWACFYIGATILGLIHPLRPIWHVYLDGIHNWWSGQPLYGDGPHGFLYLPPSILFMSPFALLPDWLSLHVWRLAHFALLTYAVSRLVGFLFKERRGAAALYIFLLLIPTAGINVLRTQVELPMFALILIGAIDIAEGAFRRGGVFLALAFMLKPLALAPALLFLAFFPSVAPSFALVCVALVAASFVYPDPSYVLQQYLAFPDKMAIATDHVDGKWFDLSHMLFYFDVKLSDFSVKMAQIGGAALTFVAAFWARRRMKGPQAALSIVILGTIYLLLFNPRVEEGSYMDIALFLAAFAVGAFRDGRKAFACLYLVAIFALSTHFMSPAIYRPTAYWIKQTVVILMMAPLYYEMRRRNEETGKSSDNPVPAMDEILSEGPSDCACECEKPRLLGS